MPEQEQSPIDHQELIKLSRTINNGLHRMLDFERQLERYSKESLILLIVLSTNQDQFETITDLLDSLEDLTGDR